MSGSAPVTRIRGNLDFLAARITDEQFERSPELAERYGTIGRRRCLEDATFHLAFLAAAADASLEAIFLDYVAWAKTVLIARGVPEQDLIANLRIVAEVVAGYFGRSEAAPLATYQRMPSRGHAQSATSTCC